MITLQLIPSSTPPIAAAVAQTFQGTTLNVQPAPGSGAETAPSFNFPQTSKPTTDFAAVRAGLRTVVETTLVDMSVAHSIAAGNAVVLPIQGTAFMIDKGTDVGNATLHIQDQTSSPINSINVFPGDAYVLPFTFVMIENVAQAGKVLRIHYGTDIQFLPSLAGTLTISGNVAITQTAAGAPQGPDLVSVNGNSYQGGNLVNGIAAQNSAIALQVNNGFGPKVYLDKIRLWVSVTGRVQITKEAVGYCNTNPAAIIKKDGTLAGGLNSFTGNNVVVTGSPFDDAFAEASKIQDIDFGGYPLVIPPNSQLALTTTTANVSMHATFFVRQF